MKGKFFIAAAVLAVSFESVPAQAADEPPGEGEGKSTASAPSAGRPAAGNGSSRCWWGPHYLIDYGIIASSLAVVAMSTAWGSPAGKAGIGPSFDPSRPDEILSQNDSGAEPIDKPYKDRDTVPAALLLGTTLSTSLALSLIAAGTSAGPVDWQGFHDTLAGATEALSSTLMVTEVLKNSVGRLRPDFQGRVLRYDACRNEGNTGIRCSDFEAASIEDSEGIVDGRKSFPSGHASTSFATATYATLVLGGKYVWGSTATTTSRAIAIPVQVGLLGVATWVSHSRVDDGRHNPTDVLAGGLIGTVLAQIAYWRRFDEHGHPRKRAAAQVGLGPGPGHVGLGVTGTF
jgi:membrane-associated phospholipid phosphatase